MSVANEKSKIELKDESMLGLIQQVDTNANIKNE